MSARTGSIGDEFKQLLYLPGEPRVERAFLAGAAPLQQITVAQSTVGTFPSSEDSSLLFDPCEDATESRRLGSSRNQYL